MNTSAHLFFVLVTLTASHLASATLEQVLDCDHAKDGVVHGRARVFVDNATGIARFEINGNSPEEKTDGEFQKSEKKFQDSYGEFHDEFSYEFGFAGHVFNYDNLHPQNSSFDWFENCSMVRKDVLDAFFPSSLYESQGQEKCIAVKESLADGIKVSIDVRAENVTDVEDVKVKKIELQILPANLEDTCGASPFEYHFITFRGGSLTTAGRNWKAPLQTSGSFWQMPRKGDNWTSILKFGKVHAKVVDLALSELGLHGFAWDDGSASVSKFGYLFPDDTGTQPNNLQSKGTAEGAGKQTYTVSLGDPKFVLPRY